MVRINQGFTLKRIVDDYVIIATGDEAVKFSAVLVLNEVGVIVFKLIQEGKTKKEITASLMVDFGIDEATASADVKRFIDKLVADGVCTCE